MTRTADGVEIEHGMLLYTCAGSMANRLLLVPHHLNIGKFWITVVNGIEQFEVPANALFSSSREAAKARMIWLNNEIRQAKGRIGYSDIISPLMVEKRYLENILNWQGEFST